MSSSTVSARTAMRELEECVRWAAGALGSAQDLAWSGAAAAAYGRSLDDLLAVVRAAAVSLPSLQEALARHLARVEEEERQASLVGAGPFCSAGWGAP